jgi:hypothetical protein
VSKIWSEGAPKSIIQIIPETIKIPKKLHPQNPIHSKNMFNVHKA